MAEKDPRIGRTTQPVTMRVEFGKIREFAAAIKDDNPIYFDEDYARREAGGVMPPPTFTMTQAFWDSHSNRIELGMDLRRVLHGGQEFEYVQPVHAGDTLTARSSITDVFKKPGKRGGEMTFAVLETQFSNQRGEIVLYSRSTIIETAKPVEKKD
ncbi:MAG: MaoC family dehydratase N-terminal domain-containing protein [Deltaproteobacteria bacterium]|nr:MaoC family dehydratase N-terminal domain-containing protein [Deltaproteobacteria bacterium]